MKYEVISHPRRDLKFSKIVSLDTEYSNLNLRKAELQSVSVGMSPDFTYVLKNYHALYGLLESADIIFTWNGVVDYFMLQKHGFHIPKEKIIDAMLLEHLVDERLDHGLGDFALREFNDNYKNEFWSKYETYIEAPEEERNQYEMRDGCYTYRAGVKYLEALKDRTDLIRHVHKLQWALFDTEVQGLDVNVELMRETKQTMSAQINGYLPKLRKEYSEHCTLWELKKWQEEIGKRSSEKGKLRVPKPNFSFSSDRQLSWLVYDSLESPILEKTKKGNPSTDYETLSKLVEVNPGLQTLLEYKKTKSVYATFVEGMLERVENNKIYPRFNVNGTTTGRISHSNPNMGNMPRDGVIRNFFIPSRGMVFIGADYSQLEVIVEANLTEDPSLLKIINEGMSKHDITSEGLGIGRDDAKTLNFALQYGAGVHKVSKILKVSQETAQDIFDKYWQLYSGVKRLKDETCKNLNEHGFVTNLFGRTRHFSKPKNSFEKGKQERQAYNFLIQGVGADVTNRAFYLYSEQCKGRALFSVHDEILAEVPTEHAEEEKQKLVQVMESISSELNFKYPLKAKFYGPLTKWEKT